MHKIINPLFSLAITAVLFLGAVSAQADEFKSGQAYRGQIAIGDKGVVVPLPPGEWRIAGYDTINFTDSRRAKKLKIHRVSMVHVQDGVLHGVIRFLTPDRRVTSGFAPAKFCDRKDIHHIVNNGNYRKDRDCWGVNHYNFSPWSKMPEYVDEMYLWLGDNNVKLPGYMIATTFNIAASSRFLDVTYFFNPEVEGLEPSDPAVRWSASEWHSYRVAKGSERADYIQKMIAWGQDWHQKVMDAVKG